MKAFLIPADINKECRFIDIPMIDRYLRICDTMSWVFFDTVHIQTKTTKFELDIVVDDNGIVNNAKLNRRASLIASDYYKDIYPLFGDALVFVHIENEYGTYDFDDLTKYGSIIYEFLTDYKDCIEVL